MDFGTTTTELTIQIKNVGAGTLSWSAATDRAWIRLDPALGDNDCIVTVTADRTGLYGGAYSGSIEVTSNGGDDTIAVSMAVAQEELAVTPSLIDFGPTLSQAGLEIRNTGAGNLEWSASATGVPWVTSLVPGFGSGNSDVEVTADRSGLSGGCHEGEISITSNGGNLKVAVTIQQPLLLNANFDSDSPGAPPELALSPDLPVGDYIAVEEMGGSTVRVRNILGSLKSKPLEINQEAGTRGVDLSAYLSGGQTCDSVTVGWQSMARSDTSFFECALIGAGGSRLAKLLYGSGGVLRYVSAGDTPVPIPVNYGADRHQEFTVLVDFTAQTTSLSIDGHGLVGFQGLGFTDPATSLERIRFLTLGQNPQIFAIDNLRALAGRCGSPAP